MPERGAVPQVPTAGLRAMDQHPTARSACMAAGIGDGALPAYQRALGTLAGRR